MQGNLTTDIIKGTALTSLVFALSAFMPIVGFFSALLIPLPVLYYRAKLGRAAAAVIAALTLIIMVIIAGRPAIDLIFFIELIWLGFVLSEILEHNLSVEKTIIYTCMAVVVSAFFILLFYSTTAGIGLGAMVSGYVQSNLELTMQLYQRMGVTPENVQILSQSLDQIHYVLVRILPALMVSATLLATWANLLIARPLLKRRNLFYPGFGPLNHWSAPDFLVWCAIGGGMSLMIPNQAIKMIGMNALIVLLVIYFLQGIAILSFFFEKKRFPRILKIFIYCLIALQQILLLLIIGLGFFDLWLNFRKLEKHTNDNNAAS